MLRSLLIYLILHIQYSLYEASPLIGKDVRKATVNELPFIVSISRKTVAYDEYVIRSHWCGGSLITVKLVLTAAHCLSNLPVDEHVVRIGSIDLPKSRPYEIEKWTPYSKWTTKHLPAQYDEDNINDIAIIQIRGTVTDIQLPSIPYTPDKDLYGKSVMIGGWGVVEDNTKPRIMRVANLIVKHPDQCEVFSSERDPILKDLFPVTRLCTTSERGTATSCGDSGSPLLSDQNTIVGVAIKACVPKKTPSTLLEHRGMHASVYAYQEFIEAMKNE